MTARALLLMVESMIVEGVGRDEYEEMLHGAPQLDRGLSVLAMGGEIA